MSGLIGVWDIEYEPKRERSEDMDHNKKKSELELGYIKCDTEDFYAGGPTERRDKHGHVVSHQDSRSFPGKNGLNCSKGY